MSPVLLAFRNRRFDLRRTGRCEVETGDIDGAASAAAASTNVAGIGFLVSSIVFFSCIVLLVVSHL